MAEELGISPGLVFYHFGTKDALVAEAFAHAVDRDLSRLDQATRARAADPLDRLRRVLRLYGPTGTAAGWRIWIDAWALAQREPVIRKVLRRLDQRWTAALLEVVEAGRGRRLVHLPRPDGVRGPGLGAARRPVRRDAGLPVSVTRAQLREWVAEAVARELGLDADALV